MKKGCFCAKLLSVMLVLTLVLSISFQTAFANDYENHWAGEQIGILVEEGIVPLDANGNTRPEDFITRAEMAQLLNRTFGLTEKGDITGFSDVNSTDWYADDMAISFGSGVFSGDNGKMRPNDPITRQEAAVVIAKASNTPEDAGYADTFADAGKIGLWAKGFVGALAKASVITGYDNGSFMPLNNIKRAEAFQIAATIAKESDAIPTAAQSVEPVKEPEPVADGDVEVYSMQTYGTFDKAQAAENILIKGMSSTVRNVDVSGDLTVSESIVGGNIFLEGVSVKGKTYIKETVVEKNNAGEVGTDTSSYVSAGVSGIDNSFYLILKDFGDKQSALSDIFMQKTDATIRLEGGNINNITFETGGHLVVTNGAASASQALSNNNAALLTTEEQNPEDDRVKPKVDQVVVKTGQIVVLTGDIENVAIDGPNSNVDISNATIDTIRIAENAEGTTVLIRNDSVVENIVTDSVSAFIGSGAINTAEVNVKGVTFQRAPGKNIGSHAGVVLGTTNTNVNVETSGTRGKDATLKSAAVGTIIGEVYREINVGLGTPADNWEDIKSPGSVSLTHEQRNAIAMIATPTEQATILFAHVDSKSDGKPIFDSWYALRLNDGDAIYIKVTAADLVTTNYYKVVVNIK